MIRSAVAGPETPQLTHRESDQEDQRLLREDQKQLEVQHKQLRDAQREQDHRARELEVAKTEFETDRAVREGRRNLGYGLAGVGVGLEVVAIVSAGLGSRTNRFITHGEPTPDDIAADASRGEIYNAVAYSSVAVGSLAILVGGALIAFDLDRGEYQLQPLATSDTKGISLSGRF